MLMNTAVPGYAVNLGVIAGIAVSATGFMTLIAWLVLGARRSPSPWATWRCSMRKPELLEPIVARR